MNITMQEKDGTKEVTVDLGNRRVRGDYTIYHSEQLCDIIKEKYDLEGYILASGPKKLAKHKGSHVGTFVFSKVGHVVETPVKTETIAEVVISEDLGVKTTATTKTTKTTKKTKTATSKAKRTAKSVAIEE